MEDCCVEPIFLLFYGVARKCFVALGDIYNFHRGQFFLQL